MLFVYDRLRLIKKSIDAMGNFSSCAAAGGFKVRRSSSVRSSFSSACSSPSSSSRDRPWPAAAAAAYQYADEYEAEQQQQQHMNGGGGGSAALAMEKLAQLAGRRRGAGAMQQLQVVRVLLVDGSVLQFRQPVKVIRLLLDYPHHFICHLDSRHLRPGHHSTLSSLLPDEELQLGHLYLLLPFHSAARTHSPAADQHRPHHHQQYPDHAHDITNSYHQYTRKHGASTSSEKTRLLASPRSELPRRSASSCSTSSSGTTAAYHYQPLRSSTKREKEGGGATSKNYSSACTNSPPPASSASSRASASSSSYSMMDRPDKLGQLGPHRSARLCDTPELQRAYRSVMLRRCRSWTPRLQAINELGRR